ncbi:hypothetical protein Ato02nite_071810 [Paractinoplanes toevensis]|uniref:Uncharacterized protein n=1 Tax=Paractinoplanes toevensis TaxID=571911 RepID=A0A919W7K3_9ACTN|nr:hypothetical protein Ato02nite_071810 [Actinoplanes toevensis]
MFGMRRCEFFPRGIRSGVQASGAPCPQKRGPGALAYLLRGPSPLKPHGAVVAPRALVTLLPVELLETDR